MPLRASVVVLGYGREEYLGRCLEALVCELEDDDELVLVDNGIVDGGLVDGGAALASLPGRVRIIGDGTNSGFAGGCNYAAGRTSGDVLVFVNSDAIVRPGSLGELVRAAAEEGAGIAGGCLRLADQPDRINSAGNPLQYLGMTWAGGCGDPAAVHQQRGAVAVATGGFFALRREVWESLAGFDPVYFAYHEDTDLSLRCWMSGRRVEYVPSAVADHYYEFSRSPHKMYLVERNRLLTVLTDYPPVVLAAVLPMLLLLEPALLAMAVLQGWQAQKLRSWGWLAAHAGQIRARRRRVQAQFTVPDATLTDLMCARIEPPMIGHPPGMGLLNVLLSGYWTLARGLVGRFGAVRGPGE